MNHDAISVQLCLSAGLTLEQADTLITRITARAAQIADQYPFSPCIGKGIAAKIRASSEYRLHTQGATHTFTPPCDGRDPMRNRT